LQGQHSERLLVIVDEAPGLDPSFWPSIEGTLASGDSRLLMLGNPTVTSGPFYDAFGRSRSAWKTFSISAFDSPNFRNVTLERLLAMSDAELDKNARPFLITRRWVRERYVEWFNGGVENSPLWAGRVLGQFPRDASNALFPLAALEQARCAPVDPGGDVVVGVGGGAGARPHDRHRVRRRRDPGRGRVDRARRERRRAGVFEEMVVAAARGADRFRRARVSSGDDRSQRGLQGGGAQRFVVGPR
jgi:hypothetical protein